MSALHNIPKHHELHGHIRQIYYDFKHLGYFDQYGSSCFAMAALTARILRAKGYDTEVRGCHAIFRNDNKEFYLGYQGYTQPGQVEGHVVCVVNGINGNIVLDFGLGNVRKHYKGYFYRAVACIASNSGPVLASVDFGNGINVQWRTDWVGPEVEGELVKQEPYLLPILAKYESYRQNRLGYLVRNIFSGPNSRATLI
ncbi:hypothetical protein GCM10011396_55620 [Undibacterium terreum]|uniref:Uncharacterized protein n=2 Tax=Undibacterium terreum TaxID=1224302 RepID=A0A916V195_9BURK|nr:hypothetical protein GCM10011396_55620 [Undibacterium terreum]